MGRPSRQSQDKRRREKKKQEKRQEKLQRKALRKEDKPEGEAESEIASAEEIAGIEQMPDTALADILPYPEVLPEASEDDEPTDAPARRPTS